MRYGRSTHNSHTSDSQTCKSSFQCVYVLVRDKKLYAFMSSFDCHGDGRTDQCWTMDACIFAMPVPVRRCLIYCLRVMNGHLKTPALLMTPSKSFKPTPLPTPLPPLASSNISFKVCSPTSSFNARATLLKQAIVILSSSPPILVNNLNASSTSFC